MHAPSTKFRRLREGAPTILALCVAAAVLSIQLFVPPIVGLANNGDFEKVMGYAGFRYLPAPAADHFWSWIETRFALAPMGWWKSGYLTSETLLALLARGLNASRSNDGLFDIRVLGAVHAGLFLAGLGMLLFASRSWPIWQQLVAAALLVLVFTDVGYVAPFNSFYSQTASLVFLFLTIGAAASSVSRAGKRGPMLFLYFFFALLFIASKPQESLQAPLLAAFGLRLAGVGWRRPGPASSWLLAVGLCVLAAWYNFQTPSGYRRLAKYGAVFRELLPHSPSPADDLRELGLDPALASLAGQPAPPAGLRGEVLDGLGYPSLVRFYLAHPARFVSLVSRAAPSAFQLRPPALGNFERSTGVPPRTKSTTFETWSFLKAKIAPYGFIALATILVAATATGFSGYPGHEPASRLAREGIITLVLMACVEFLVCVMADSLFGLPRHLYLCQALLDFLVLLVAIRFIIGIRSARGRRNSIDGQLQADSSRSSP